jgi:hypothetical protein
VSRIRIALLAVFVVACGPSEEEIKAEFDAFVSIREDCTVDADCVIASTGCPLGCGTAVNREHEEEVEAKANELIEDYEGTGRACEYTCPQLVAVCKARHCDEEPL